MVSPAICHNGVITGRGEHVDVERRGCILVSTFALHAAGRGSISCTDQTCYIIRLNTCSQNLILYVSVSFGGETKIRWSFYLVSMPEEVKFRSPSGGQCAP